MNVNVCMDGVALPIADGMPGCSGFKLMVWYGPFVVRPCRRRRARGGWHLANSMRFWGSRRNGRYAMPHSSAQYTTLCQAVRQAGRQASSVVVVVFVVVDAWIRLGFSHDGPRPTVI